MRILFISLIVAFASPLLASESSQSTTPPEVPCYTESGELIGSNVPITECEIHHM